MWFRRLTIVGIGLAAVVGLIAWVVRPPAVPPPAWAADYDVTARTPETIAPGTVVGQSAPAGWSHLVIKSKPRVRPGEIPRIPKNPFVSQSEVVERVSWMFTAFVADVRPEEHPKDGPKHRLRAVALGLGTTVGGRDTVITPETAEQHGVKLTWITRTILEKGYETQRLAVVVVHGPTLAVVDTPVWYRCGEKNRLIRFRYALLVDGESGRLDTVVWLLDPEGGCGNPAAAGVLAPDTVDEAELIPDPAEFGTVGIPSDAAFAVDGLPPARARLLLPPDLRPLSAATKFSPDDARALEAGLRRLVAPHAP